MFMITSIILLRVYLLIFLRGWFSSMERIVQRWRYPHIFPYQQRRFFIRFISSRYTLPDLYYPGTHFLTYIFQVHFLLFIILVHFLLYIFQVHFLLYIFQVHFLIPGDSLSLSSRYTSLIFQVHFLNLLGTLPYLSDTLSYLPGTLP